MKPENWRSLSSDQKHKHAVELIESPRGRFLIGQALAIAETVYAARNDEDIAMIGEALFRGGYTTGISQSTISEILSAKKGIGKAAAKEFSKHHDVPIALFLA